MSEQRISRIRVRTEKTYKTLYSELKQLNLGDAHTVFLLPLVLDTRRAHRNRLNLARIVFGEILSPRMSGQFINQFF